MAFFDVLRILFFPALIALASYALITYVFLPLYRSHYARYSQYIPVNALSERTRSLRSSMQHTLTRWILPRHLQWRFDMQSGAYAGRRGSASDSEGDLFEAEEGERMAGFDVRDRERLPPTPRAQDLAGHSDRRLSRDLESGFRDASESDESGDDRRR